MDIATCGGLVINMPVAFADPAFLSWLFDGSPRFSWAQDGKVDEWSDVIVLVDPGLSGAGSDDDMPDPYWNQIIEACRSHLGPDPLGHRFHYMVRLTNLAA